MTPAPPSTAPSHALLLPVGSGGDVLPFIGIGKSLKARGLHVTVITNGHFRPLVESAGLGFIEVGTAAEYDQAIRDPDIWHPLRGPQTVGRWVAQGIERHYHAIQIAAVPGRTIVAAASLGLGALVAQEKLGLPTASVHLQPSLFRSYTAPPRLGSIFSLPYMPRAYVRFMYWLIDKALIDPIFARPLNGFRATLGLPPVRRAFHRWIHSPTLTLGLFPEFFAPPLPPGFPNVQFTGFPLYDLDHAEPTPAETDALAFAASSDLPWVFTAGTANVHAAHFFKCAVEASQLANRNAILLTQYPAQLPPSLPPNVRHYSYVPLSRLLPKAGALIYHGGIGTCSQALAAGVPHLITPLSHDQPDNARRIRDLGVGDFINPRHLTGPLLAKYLTGPTVASPQTAQRCQELSQLVRNQDAMKAICHALLAMPLVARR